MVLKRSKTSKPVRLGNLALLLRLNLYVLIWSHYVYRNMLVVILAVRLWESLLPHKVVVITHLVSWS